MRKAAAVLLGLVLLAVTVFLGRQAVGVGLDETSASMNAVRPVQAHADERFRQAFGGGEVLLAGVTHPRILDGEGVQLLEEVGARIEMLDGVRRVTSLASARRIVAGPYGAEERPLVEGATDRPGLAAEIEAALDDDPLLATLLVSPDRRTAALAIELDDPAVDGGARASLIEDLRAILAEPRATGFETHLTGIAVQKHDAMRLVRRDQRLLLPISGLVLALVLALIFRRLSGVVLPLLVTAITIAWTLGLYAWLGYRVNIITSLLPPVVMVLSLSTSVHLYQEWLLAGRRFDHAGRLVRHVVRSLVVPCFLTALTTALGLATLAVIEIPAVRQFGLFAALGVMLAFALNMAIVPVGLRLLPPPRTRKGRGPVRLGRVLSRAGRLAARRPRTVLLVAAVPTLLGLWGATAIRNNTDLVRFFKPGSTLARDTAFIDRELGGASGLELMLERTDRAPLTGLEDVRRLAAFADEVGRLEHTSQVLSISDVIRRLHRAETGSDELSLPDDPDDLLYTFDLLEAAERQEDVRRLITPELAAARVTVRTRTIGTAAAADLLAGIEEVAGRTLGAGYVLTPAGAFHNMTVDSNRLVGSQVRSMALALATIGLVMAVLLRSPRLLLAALIPNVVPLVWTAGIMGWLGIDLSTGTAMIAAVVLGIAVDDTIHYLARFRREHRGHRARAIMRTGHGVGRALVVASVVLALGFWVGALGSFKPTVYFSLLSGVTILSALLCDLLVLPACLMLVRPAAREVKS